jgi:hypothetical protein
MQVQKQENNDFCYTSFVNALKPRLLSYIFHILSKVLKYKETHGEIKHPNGLNRMADWEEYSEIISRCIGNPDGELQLVYQENINKQVDDAVASSQYVWLL